MSEMIERVAMAIEKCRIDGYGTDVEIAHAAIKEMREPTDDMKEAGVVLGDPEWGGISVLDTGGVWERMIDAALATEPVS